MRNKRTAEILDSIEFEDPFAMNNLLGSNPDASKYAAKVAEFEFCFEEWLENTLEYMFTG